MCMKNSTSDSGMTRRRFLTATGLALAAPTIVPASALGQGNQPAPSERVTLGDAFRLDDMTARTLAVYTELTT